MTTWKLRPVIVHMSFGGWQGDVYSTEETQEGRKRDEGHAGVKFSECTAACSLVNDPVT